MNKELENLTAIIHKNLGKNISVYDQSFLMRTMDKRKAELGISDTADFCNLLNNTTLEAEKFIHNLSIQYTEFFRESITYSLMEKVVLPQIICQIKDGQEIRIWSAGCSYGQEPYSIAMMLSDLSECSQKEFRFRIFATDHSEQALVKARNGIYTQDAIKNVKFHQLEKYFMKQENTYTVISQLKKHVDFSYYDILDKETSNPPDSIYGDFNLVMCCNLLIYYNQEYKKIIIKKLLNALMPGGCLITGDVEKKCVEDILKKRGISITGPVFFRE